MPARTSAPQDHLAQNGAPRGADGEPEDFVWTSPGGVEVRLPNAKAYVRGGDFRRVRKLDGNDAMWELIETAVRRAIGDVEDVEAQVELAFDPFDEITLVDLNQCFEEWVEHGAGATPGESSSSSA